MMNLLSLQCPNCGAKLEIEDGLDIFFCKYCGHKILLEGQSRAAYQAKVRIKQMDHKERLQDKRNAQERYILDFKKNDEKRTLIISCSIFIVLGIIISTIILLGNIGTQHQEHRLHSTVDQIMIDIKNEDYAAAYIKANSLYWNDSWTSEGEDKWNATRKEIINQIKEAEKKVTGTTTGLPSEENNNSFWNWFD